MLRSVVVLHVAHELGAGVDGQTLPDLIEPDLSLY
jgi:hypothetical protein